MSYGAQIPISNNVDPTIGGWTTILNGLPNPAVRA